MQIRHYEEYTDFIKINIPVKRYLSAFQKSLDDFLAFAESAIGDKTEKYSKSLSSAINSEINRNNDIVLQMPDELCSGYQYYNFCPHLFKNNYQLVRHILDFNDSDIGEDGTLEIETEKFHKARFLPGYIRLQVLVDFMPRKKAIESVMNYIDKSIEDMEFPSEKDISLMEFMEKQKKFNLECQDMCWTNAVVSNHKYINKVTKCKIHEVLKEYEDKELMEVVACYPDFAMLKKTSGNFVMTRTKTLIGGFNICDTCYHDVMHSDRIKHPDIEIFNSLTKK